MNQTQERKKLADGIYEGDLLLLELTDGRFFRGWLQDLFLTSEGQPAAFKTDAGMVELAQVKTIRIGQVRYLSLEEVVQAEKALEAEAEAEATKEAE